MPPQLKRTLPWADAHQDEYNEDFAPYTRVRLVMQNGSYETEIDLLRLKNAELEARVNELESDMERILNIEMDDVVLLKEDMLSYYRQYRESQLEIMELEEEISKLRADANHQSLGQSPLEEGTLIRGELGSLEEKQLVAHTRQVDQGGVTSFEKQGMGRNVGVDELPAKDCIPEYVPDLRDVSQTNAGPDLRDCAGASSCSEFDEHIDGSSENISNMNSTHSTSSLTSLDTLPYPTGAPSSGWFFEAFHYLNTALGPQYIGLLQEWVDYERKHHWLNPHKLAGFSPEKRPTVLLDWMKNRPRPLPKVDKRGFFTPNFAEEVWAWWASLQPQWRLLDEGGLPVSFEQFGDDLSPLNKHGRNAWVGLLACIKWWGIGLKHYASDDHELYLSSWHSIVADMAKMLGKLVVD
ncbi:hypothetical protein HHX47_DHR7000159 [Lentinula edodes]|nr:hypothetical protein HHX47_DHR7000159 [Lentinula edodes]